MLKDERQHWILEKLVKCKKVSLVALSQELAVSYDSIRRDVLELEERGLLKKVHGGAISNCYLPMRPRKEMGNPKAEIPSIAQKAQPLFRNGQIILMDGGTTNLHIAEHIPHHLQATIVTNSPSLAVSLSSHPLVEIILLGGSYHKRYQITLGCETSVKLRHFRADLYFMGVAGIHPNEGLTISHYEEAQLKRQMMAIAAQTIVCATAEKVTHVEPYQVCHLKDIHTLIASDERTLYVVKEWHGLDLQVI